VTERQREYITALRILGWGAVVIALGISALIPTVEEWVWLSTS
jgi:hypothetical protein